MAAHVSIVKVRVDWDHTAIPLRLRDDHFHTLRIDPEPGYPVGRKGLALAGAWRQLSGHPPAAGMLILDGDVAIDPLDLAIMYLAIEDEPDAVHTAPARLWATSTGLPAWIWAHGLDAYSQRDTTTPNRFSFCFTFLPRLLIEAVEWDELAYPMVDRTVSGVAQKLGIPVRVARGCTVKHLNF